MLAKNDNHFQNYWQYAILVFSRIREAPMVYDLIVVGNGLAAQTFLFELFAKLNDKQCQNFSVAQIFSEEIAPSCSLRTTATVSLNGIEEDVSDLGNYLRESYFAFIEFNKIHSPAGVELVSRHVTCTNEIHEKKLIRRFKKIAPIKHPFLKKESQGVALDSYLVYPEAYADWFNQKNGTEKITQYKNFLKATTLEKAGDGSGIINCEMLGGETLKTKKIVFCTGAYAKIYAEYFAETADLATTDVVAGSYLEKSIDLGIPSQYITIDGHTLIYRSLDHTLLIGSSSIKDAVMLGNISELKEIYQLFLDKSTIPLGEFSDFKMITGLRHKTKRRLPMASALNAEKTIYMINGFYKNGFSFSHLFSKKIVAEIH